MANQGQRLAAGERQKAEALDAAARLAAYFRSGGRPTAVLSSLLLDPGEFCYGEGHAALWQYTELDDLTYTHVVGPSGNPSLALAAAVGNRYRRRKAEQVAAFQWRCAGVMPLVVTSRRLMVFEAGQWVTYCELSSIRQLHPDLMQMRLTIAEDGLPLTACAGPFVPWLSVLLVYLLYGEVLQINGFSALPPAP